MLLRRFTAGSEAGRGVLEIDARVTQPTPEAFEREAAPVVAGERTVPLIDTFERCQALEDWLRAAAAARGDGRRHRRPARARLRLRA
jgi:hypothetical protein